MGERLAGGNVALALLGNTLPTGAILVVPILALGPISGAHFNPAVSLVMSLRKDHPWREFFPYAGAQIAGGCIGTLSRTECSSCLCSSLRSKRALARRNGSRNLSPPLVSSSPFSPCRVSRARRFPCGWSLHNGGLLVHRIDLLRQSCRYDRPRADEQLFGDRASRRAHVHRRTVRRRIGGARRHELVFQRVRGSRASSAGWSGPSALGAVVDRSAYIGDGVLCCRQVLGLSPASGDRCHVAWRLIRV